MPEKDLHPIVVNYLKEGMKCFAAKKGGGQDYVGIPDAFGIKDIGGLYKSNIIGIAVEVKPNLNSIAKKLGQALGYSLFSHRCYLAVPKVFSPDHIEMANKLGVGLLQIKDNTCEKILDSQSHEPIENLFLSAVYNLGWCRCDICGEFKEHNKRFTEKNIRFALKDNRIYHRKITPRDKVYYSSRKDRYSFTICPDCMNDISINNK